MKVHCSELRQPERLRLGRKTRRVALSIALAALAVGVARAQSSIYWDINGSTNGAGGATPSGTWSSSATNWNTNSSGGAGSIGGWSGTLNTAVFSAGGDATGTYSITVSGGIQIGGITVEEGSPVIGGSGSLTFAYGDGRQQMVSVAGGSTVAINVGIALTSGSLGKSGTGTLVLGADNSGLSRAIAVTQGTLGVAHANALGSGTLTMSSGTTLDLRNVTLSRALAVNGWTLAATTNSTSTQSGALTLSGTSNVNVDSTSQLTINSSIGGTGALQKTGAGLLIVSGTNNYSGNTILNAGTLRVDSGSALSTGNLNFTGGTLRYGAGFTTDLSQRISSSSGAVSIDTNAQNITFGNALNSSNTGGLTKLGAGNLTLSAANAYTGVTTFAAGNLVVNNSGALSSGNLSFTGGTLRYGSGVTTDYSQRIANSTGAMSIDTNGQNVTFGNAISSTNTGGLTKLGNGTLTLSGANAYTGNTTVSAGTLTLGANMCSRIAPP
jgi:autotransporter-associated beta strand protein